MKILYNIARVMVFFVLIVAAGVNASSSDIPRGYTEIDCVLVPINRTQRQSHPHIPSRLPLKDQAYSTNWSGYVAETNLAHPAIGSVSAISGSWTVPTITASTINTFCAIWIGIDGYDSPTVEQIGTEHDWSHGAVHNYAWFEMYPRDSYMIQNFPVNPGDAISATIVYAGSGVFTMRIFNNTQHVTATIPAARTTYASAKRSSAEWVVEAPSLNGILKLSDFSPISFFNCTATINGITGSINSPHWANSSIIMETTNNITKATPSLLSLDGGSFTVTWNHQ